MEDDAGGYLMPVTAPLAESLRVRTPIDSLLSLVESFTTGANRD
jgi:hypothetical protein